MTKLIIEISGGSLVSVQSTEDVQYVLIDHDNLKSQRVMGGKVNNEFSFYSPDLIVTEEELNEEIEIIKKAYES